MSENETKPAEQKVPLDPTLATQINQKGVQFSNIGECELAEHFYRAAYACNPDDLSAAGNILSSLGQQGKSGAALSFAEAEFEQNKDKPWFMQGYADILVEAGQCQKAVGILNELEGHETYGEGTYFEFIYAKALLGAGKPHDATDRFKKVNELSESANLYSWLNACFEPAGTFAANKGYMTDKLLASRRDTDLSLAVRRYYLAMFYEKWAEADSTKAETYLTFAQEYANEALEDAQMNHVVGKENNDLENIQKLAARVEKALRKIKDGFEPPEGWSPGNQ